MIKAVVFDLDDTLISEKQYIMSGYQYISQVLGSKLNMHERLILKTLTELFEESSRSVFNRFYDELGLVYQEEDILFLVKEYREHFPTISFFEDVHPCIDRLRKQGMKLGIITDGYACAQHQKLKALKAINFFDEIIVTDDLGREYWKPHPKSFEIMKERLGVEFNEMIYLGDNPEKDFYIAKYYPIKTIRICRDGVYKKKSYLENVTESHSIFHLHELKFLLK